VPENAVVRNEIELAWRQIQEGQSE
jgi:hypothetical protein